MLEALAKDALINLQGLLPSSLAEQPSSSQAQGGGMTSPRSPTAWAPSLGTGLWSAPGRWQEAGLLLCEREWEQGCCRPHSVPAARWSSSMVGTDVGARSLLLHPSGVAIGRVPAHPRGHTNLQPLPKVSWRGGTGFEGTASPQCTPSAPRAAGGGRAQFLSCSEKNNVKPGCFSTLIYYQL